MSSLSKKGSRLKHKTKKYSTLVTDEGRVCRNCGKFKSWSDYWPSRKPANCADCMKLLRKKLTLEEKEAANKRGAKWVVKTIKTLKKENPSLYKARNTRTSLLARVRKLGLNLKSPSVKDLETWFKSQEPWTCYYSGKPVPLSRVHVDHKIPITRGGDNSLSNLCIADSYYNEAKGQLTEKEFKELLDLASKWEDKGKYLLARLKQGYKVMYYKDKEKET